MKISASEAIEAIHQHRSQPLHEAILAQGAWLNRREIEKSWPAALSKHNIPVSKFAAGNFEEEDPNNPSYVRVSRAGLFHSAELIEEKSSTPQLQDIADLYIRIIAWGTGHQNVRSLRRFLNVLNEPHSLEKLRECFVETRRATLPAVHLYRNLVTKSGEWRINGLGHSFGTKWLYFCGYEPYRQAEHIPPLILDSRIMRNLGITVPSPDCDTYASYLYAAAQIAKSCGGDPASELEPHVGEFLLFATPPRAFNR